MPLLAMMPCMNVSFLPESQRKTNSPPCGRCYKMRRAVSAFLYSGTYHIFSKRTIIMLVVLLCSPDTLKKDSSWTAPDESYPNIILGLSGKGMGGCQRGPVPWATPSPTKKQIEQIIMCKQWRPNRLVIRTTPVRLRGGEQFSVVRSSGD